MSPTPKDPEATAVFVVLKRSAGAPNTLVKAPETPVKVVATALVKLPEREYKRSERFM
jgi:hypothetical protein